MNINKRDRKNSMKKKFLSVKLHCVRVTQTELNYHGSITLDRNFLEASGMKPLEFVCIWNKGNGKRFETYILPGKKGSKIFHLPGIPLVEGLKNHHPQ